MVKCKRFLTFKILIVLLLLINISCVFAADNHTEPLKDSVICQDDFDKYFDSTNTLKDDFKNSTVVFEGDFKDMGVITVNSSNVKIRGENSSFINTALCVEGDNVSVSHISFKMNRSFESNSNSCVFIKSDNASLSDLFIECGSPEDTTSIGISSYGGSDLSVDGCVINFTGRCFTKAFSFGVLIRNVENLIISNTKINCMLPLRGLVRDYTTYGNLGVVADAGIALDSVKNLNFESNLINVSVNSRLVSYASLDACFFYGCENALIKNNTLLLNDFITPQGLDSSLYGFFIQKTSHMTFYKNDIGINATGGSPDSGVAYPIQLKDIGCAELAFNSIKSESSGAACGIFSKICDGSELHIISNSIDVCGCAGGQYWSFLSGIEAENTNTTIWNNSINVCSSDHGSKNNIYAISFSQYSGGTHNYDIRYNKIKSDGIYSVYLKDCQSCIVSSNQLNSSKSNGDKSVYASGNNCHVLRNVHEVMGIENSPEWLLKLNEKMEKTESSPLKTPVKNTAKKVKISMLLKKVKIKKSARKITITVKLKINGKNAKGKKITFRFLNKKFKVKTNKKGIAKVVIKKSLLKKLKVGKKVKYQATYAKRTVKRTVVVRK